MVHYNKYFTYIHTTKMRAFPGFEKRIEKKKGSYVRGIWKNLYLNIDYFCGGWVGWGQSFPNFPPPPPPLDIVFPILSSGPTGFGRIICFPVAKVWCLPSAGRFFFFLVLVWFDHLIKRPPGIMHSGALLL